MLLSTLIASPIILGYVGYFSSKGSSPYYFGKIYLYSKESFLPSYYFGEDNFNPGKSFLPFNTSYYATGRAKSVSGVDALPSYYYRFSDNGAFTALTYRTADGSLYGSHGPVMEDVNQGSVGDCYFLSALQSVADANPSKIRDMITYNGDNTYNVKFFINGGDVQYVNVNKKLPWIVTTRGQELLANQHNGGGLWASLIEKAYVQLHSIGSFTGVYSNVCENSYTSINSGLAYVALEEITGSSKVGNILFQKDNTGMTSRVFYNEYSQSNFNTEQLYSMQPDGVFKSDDTRTKLLNLEKKLTKALDSGISLIINTGSSYASETRDSNGRLNFVKGHSESIYGYHTGADGNILFDIRNPWGVSSKNFEPYNPTFSASIEEIASAGISISSSASVYDIA